ncbi:MAG: DUF2341 domain-containing protein [Patescibacteria group bacterium]
MFPLNVHAQCDGDGYVVVCVNGVFTPTETEAKKNTKDLEEKYVKKFDISNITFLTGYNPSHIAGLGDLIQTASQILNNPVSDYDLKTILVKLHPQINTKKILLVGHSQGTFYTNELYNYLINNGIPEESIGVYNVATPADFVAGNGKYLTSQNDKVVNNVRNVAKNIKVKQPLPQNINIPLNEQNDPNGHSFSKVYLAGAPEEIISKINNALKNLDDTQQTTNTSDAGCFNLPDQNFSYKIQKLIYFAADPVSKGIVKAGTATYHGVVFAGDFLTTGVAFVLDPIFNLFQKQTVANIHDIKFLIGAIGQLFDRQDTNYLSSFQELSEQQSQQLEDALNKSQNSENLITESVNLEEQSELLNQEDIEQNQELEKPQEEIEKIPESQYFAGDIVINELMPSPLENKNEWIELYNRTDKSIDLFNWTIEDNTANPKTLKNKTIPSHGWMVLNGGQDFGFQLNNSGDTIVLKYNKNLIDQMGYGDFNDGNIHDNPDTPSKGESLIRYPDGQDKNQDDQDFLITATPTPGSANLFTKPEILTSEIPSSDDKINNISYQSFQFQDAVINEIAWAGTKADSTDEWIELYNNSGKPINLAGWRLKAADGSPNILLTGEIPAHGYWLLERTDDEVIKNVTADQIYSGALEDSGETLELIDGNSNRIDFINQANGWLAGDSETKASMERINSTLTGIDTNNWHTNNGQDFLWFDAKNNKVLGTPKNKNSPKIANTNYDTIDGVSSSSSQKYQSYQPLNVIVNEIAWMGTVADYNDEWIELYNNLDQEIDLSGWTLKAKDGSPDISLSGKIAGRDFFILERTDDEVIKNVTADQIYSGALGNSGEDLELRDGNNNLIDEVNCAGPWFFGDNTTKASMERMDSLVLGNSKDNWQTAYYQDQTAQDAGNNPIFGSPKNKNTEKPEEKDIISPEISLTQKPATLTNLTTANFGFSINEEGGVLCKIDEQNLESCSSPQIYSNLTEGNHIFYLKAIDQANNFSEMTYSWDIDLTRIISSPTTSGIFNSLTWPGKIEGITSSNGDPSDLSLVEIQIQKNSENKYLGYATSTLDWIDQPTWLETILNENNWHFNLPAAILTDGLYSISSQAIDLVGNIQNTTSTTEFIFDSTPPEKVNPLILNFDQGAMKINLSWDKVNDNLSGIDHYEINWGQNTTSTAVTNFELPVQDRENYSFKVRAVDKAGNFGEWSELILYFVKLPSVVISEVQIAGQTVNDEFIELYNSTDQEIDLADWKLTKKTASGTENTILSDKTTVKFFGIIPAKGYFLISHPDSSFTFFSDLVHGGTQSLASNNTLILYDLEGKIIDKVGWGTASDFETSPAPESLKNQSIERGNLQDTDNNLNDFSVQLIPGPTSSKGSWLNNWQKRKLLVIDNTQNNNDLTNFEINIGIDYESEMNTDFSDIRFTDSNKTTLLNYGWEINDDGTDQKQDGVSATAVVKIPFIPKRAQKIIYLYYDNSAATNVANLEGLSSAVEGNWFDHFKTNRSSEYEYQNYMTWNITKHRVEWSHGGEPNEYYLRPKNLSAKNVSAKIRTTSAEDVITSLPTLRARQVDENNFWFIRWDFGEWTTPKAISGFTENGAESQQFNSQFADYGGYWFPCQLTLNLYETEQKGKIIREDTGEVKSFSTFLSNINSTGNVEFFQQRSGSMAMGQIDYFYVRQNTKPWPTVFETEENYQPIILPETSYPEMPGWEKRKEIIITNNNTEDLSNFEVNLNILYDSKMNQDFSDIRFTADDKITPINYGWDINDDGSDQKQDGISATAVVKIPLMSAFSETKIYMYYGNNSASAVASLENTLTWFDHFKIDKSNEYEYLPNGLKWTTTWDTTQHKVNFYGSMPDPYIFYLRPKNFSAKNVYIKTRSLSNDAPTLRARKIDENNFWFISRRYPGGQPLHVESGFNENGIKNLQLDAPLGEFWHNTIYILDLYETTQKGTIILEDTGEKQSFSTVLPNINSTGDAEWLITRTGSNAQGWIDYFYIRQNTEIMPTVSFEE